MALSIEDQIKLRALYDAKVVKRQAGMQTGIAEATVSRYYEKWKALERVHGKELFDFTHLRPTVLAELRIQATMRRMSLYSFVYNLLTTVAHDNLSKSILDIEDDDPVKQRLANER